MQTKLTLKTILPYLIIGVLIVIASFFMKGCHDKPYVNTPAQYNKPQYAKEDTIHQILNKWAKDKHKWEHENDSLTKLLFKRINHKKSTKDSLILVTDSNCVKSLILLYNECDRVDSVYTQKIKGYVEQNKKDSIATSELFKLVNIKQERIVKDSTYIEHLQNDSIPLVYRKRFWKGYKNGFSHGFGTGVVVTKGADVITKLK